MKASYLIQKLSKLIEENGDHDIMFTDPNGNGGPFLAISVKPEVAGENEYPEEYNMPEGFKFFLIDNF